MDWEHGRRAVGISAAHWEPEGLTDYNPKSLTRSVAPGCWCVIFSSSTVNGNKGIEAEVEYAETTGKEFVVHLQVGDTSVTLVLPGDTPPSKIAKHAKGRLEMQPEYFHLFDKESGKRI